MDFQYHKHFDLLWRSFVIMSIIKILKTNKRIAVSWLILGVLGYIVSYFVIKPMIYTWPHSYQFADDTLYNLYQLLIANIFILPAMIVAIIGSFNSAKKKQYAWTTVDVVGFTVLAFSIIYFSLPIIFPAHGL